MNVVLAVAVLTGLFMVSYEKIIDDNGAVVGHVMPDSPAAKAGIQPGDKIVRLNGKDNPDWEDIITTEIESVAAADDGDDRAQRASVSGYRDAGAG